MNKQELLQKIKDEVGKEFFELSFNELTIFDKAKSWPEITDRYAIACCEEQKREIANVVSGGVGTLHELLKKAILETKNVAESTTPG